ncbi:TPA: hypothetical protein ACH3X1_004680 [Trebouxia sp. C0004]
MSRRIRVLNVAEKPSVQREVSSCLSGGTAARVPSGRCSNYVFEYNINGQPCEMVFAAVAGHLQSLEFTEQYKKWHGCAPVELYTAPVVKFVPEDKKDLQRNLEQQARHCEWLVLWLDCDREGENIAYEVIDVCKKVQPHLVVKRARFSALIARDLHHAVSHLVEPNENDSKAVDARQEIDLRIGASFTRLQTLLLQTKFDWQANGVDERPLISYGPCQFPTLGLIVQRAWEIQAHIPEDFWHIQVTHTAQDHKKTEFSWDRGRLFDHTAATVLYEVCVEEPLASVTKASSQFHAEHPLPKHKLVLVFSLHWDMKIIQQMAKHHLLCGCFQELNIVLQEVCPTMLQRWMHSMVHLWPHASAIYSMNLQTLWLKAPVLRQPATVDASQHTLNEHINVQVQGKEKKRWPPLPLSTLEMQKKATQALHMPGERIMKIAEELYQAGFISYPRTETDSFPPSQDLMALVREHEGDPRWGSHAQAIVHGNMWKPPGNGGHDDKAHPPIHPTKHTAGESNWPSEKTRLYEFIVRSFLATCSKPAVGFETRLEICVAGEGFSTTGLMVTERNWLQVYPYTKWGGNESLPHLQEGQTFMPSQLMLKEGRTQPAARLSERDLIALMEQHNIGTDATVAEHIQKQLDRGYATKDGNLTFWPTSLGEALVGAYRKMGLENLWLPNLRGKIEANITAVAHGARSKESVLQEAVEFFKADFEAASQKQSMMDAEVALFFSRAAGEADAYNSDGSHAGDFIGPCHSCGFDLMLRQREGQKFVVACTGAPSCKESVYLPRATLSVSVSEDHCQDCHHAIVHKLNLRFRAAQIPPGTPPTFHSCIIHDRQLKTLLAAMGPSRPPGGQAGAGSRGPFGSGRGHTGSGRGASLHGSRGSSSANGRGGRRGGGMGSRGGGRPAANHRGHQRSDSDGDDNPRPARRARGSAARGTTRGRGSSRAGRSSTAGRFGSSGRSSNNNNRWSSNGVPLCPRHGLECLSLTANTSNNPGRRFFKCSHQTEADACLKFAWADEYDGAPAGHGRGGSSRGTSHAGRNRGQGGRQGQNGGQFVTATGHSAQTCYKCGEPGHWSNACPDI